MTSTLLDGQQLNQNLEINPNSSAAGREKVGVLLCLSAYILIVQ